jgi:hypothetical protein
MATLWQVCCELMRLADPSFYGSPETSSVMILMTAKEFFSILVPSKVRKLQLARLTLGGSLSSVALYRMTL